MNPITNYFPSLAFPLAASPDTRILARIRLSNAHLQLLPGTERPSPSQPSEALNLTCANSHTRKPQWRPALSRSYLSGAAPQQPPPPPPPQHEPSSSSRTSAAPLQCSTSSSPAYPPPPPAPSSNTHRARSRRCRRHARSRRRRCARRRRFITPGRMTRGMI